jgi:hypothetical protein
MLGEICGGCGSRLGFRKYQFRRQWRIPGVYCKECMIKIGKNFEESTTGTTTLTRQQCSLCKNEFYFLRGPQGKKYCNFCQDVVAKGEPMPTVSGAPQGTKQMPRSTMIAGARGIILMAAGLIFTFITTPGEGGNMLSVLFGSATTVAGFLLFRKTMQSRRMIYGSSASGQGKHA